MTDESNRLSSDTFIRERERAIKRGKRQLLEAISVKDEAELHALIAKARANPEKAATQAEQKQAESQAVQETPRKPGESKGDHQERVDAATEQKLAKMLDERLGPVLKQLEQFVSKDSARESAQKEAAEEAQKQAATEKEIKRFERVAKRLGVKADDLDDVRSLYGAQLAKMDEDEFDAAFGEKVPAKEQEVAIEKLLTEKVKPRYASLFPAEKKQEEKPAADGKTDAKAAAEVAAKPGEKPAEPPTKVNTTGTSGVTADKASQAAATGKPFSVEGLTPKQFREYMADRNGFRERWTQGQVQQTQAKPAQAAT